MTVPRALSSGEEAFALHCQIYHMTPVREYEFAKDRGHKWRFDFFFAPDLAVEIEGGIHRIGRHQRPDGFVRDTRKYNEAALMGIRVLRFTTAMVISGEAIDTVRAAIRDKESP